MAEARGQLLYEWRHLKRKLKQRDPRQLQAFESVKSPVPHPLFRIVPGKVRTRVTNSNGTTTVSVRTLTLQKGSRLK